MSLPIEAELTEFVDDSWLIREFTSCVALFYRSLETSIGSQRLFLFIVLRASGFSPEKPKISPRTHLSTSTKVSLCRTRYFHARRKRRNP
jgi:hypothetical protein